MMAETIGNISQKISCSTDWEIENFSSLSTKEGDSYNSPDFECAGATWNLVIYPNGFNTEYAGFTSLYLKMKKSENKRLVNFQITIKRVDGTDYLSSVTKTDFYENRSWGWAEFVQRSKLLKDMNQLAGKSGLKISCTISYDKIFLQDDDSFPQDGVDFISEESLNTKSPETDCITSRPALLETITRSLKDLFLTQRYCDIIIEVHGHHISAHRAILVARSQIFAAMIDKNAEVNHVVKMGDFHPDNVRNFLLYLYCGDVDQITLDNVFELYVLSNEYAVGDLKKESVQFMKQNLSKENVSDVLFIAEKYNEVQLGEAARLFLTENATDVLTSDHWKKFKKDNPLTAHDILKTILMDNASKIKT